MAPVAVESMFSLAETPISSLAGYNDRIKGLPASEDLLWDGRSTESATVQSQTPRQCELDIFGDWRSLAMLQSEIGDRILSAVLLRARCLKYYAVIVQ